MGDAIDRGFSLVTLVWVSKEKCSGNRIRYSNWRYIQTGSSALATAKPFYRWGLGRKIFSILMGSQGTMGVVYKGIVKIFPHPHHKTIKCWAMGNPYDMQNLTLQLGKTRIRNCP